MTTNTTHSVPVPPAAEPSRKGRWLPRSPEAAGLLLLTAVSFAWPFVLAAWWSYVFATGCFFDCSEPDPVAAAVMGLLAAAIAAIPFAAVRIFQAEGRFRLSARVATILLADAAAVVFTTVWLWPV